MSDINDLKQKVQVGANAVKDEVVAAESKVVTYVKSKALVFGVGVIVGVVLAHLI